MAVVGARYSARLAGVGLLERSVGYRGGEIGGSLLGGRAAWCIEVPWTDSLGSCFCGTALGARLSVETAEFGEAGVVHRPLWAAGAELELDGRVTRGWGWGLRAVPLFPIHQEKFVVVGEGTAFQTSPLAGWVSGVIWMKFE